jgi:predicted nuclease of predicted toxin-antitoxin system
VRWLADECVAAPLVASLRSLIGLAAREKRILLTEDKDFGDLIVRRKHTVPGLVLIRIASEEAALNLERCEQSYLYRQLWFRIHGF